MRKSKPPAPHSSAAPADKAVERLYRGIPADYQGSSSPPSEEPPRRPIRKFIIRSLLVLLLIAALTGLWIGWKVVGNGVRLFGWNGVISLFTTRELKGEKDGRVTILLAGNSADDPGHQGAALTDSIMLVSINTKDKTGYLLSIPRDLYVEIPGYGYAKINEAYQHGEASNFQAVGYPSGGMGLLERVVSERFGVDIHYYALVNYAALEQAVNAVGGITLTINSTDSRGLYDPSRDIGGHGGPLVDLPNGPATLDGRAALNLARARGNARGSYGFATSDFARTEHQRQILVALKDKAASAATLSNPIKVGELFDAIGGNVQTDLSLGEANRAYRLTRGIGSTALTSASLSDVDNESLLQNYTTRRGQSALAPRVGVDDYTEIQAFVRTLESR